MPTNFDYIVVGAGILGAACALELQNRNPGARILVLEKASHEAAHQTGHNSGVIHAGVYYAPGSLKARFCKEGNRETYAFCNKHQIPYQQCGKLLVATDDAELERMRALAARAAENGIELELLDQAQLAQREPNVTGLGAIYVPSTGIVSYRQITAKLLELFRERGGAVHFDEPVTAVSEGESSVCVQTAHSQYCARQLVACAGLMADKLVEMLGQKPDFRILPFRGEYFVLPPAHNQIVNHLIYPIPDPTLPFLGVHLTRMIDGSVTVGPNAVLATAREGYRKKDISLRELAGMCHFKGTFRLLKKHWRAGLSEFCDSLSRAGYLKRVQKYCPQLTLNDLGEYPAGVRAQAVSPQGELIDDFRFVRTARCLVVCNAPSPAATSALPISRHIVDQVEALAGSA